MCGRDRRRDRGDLALGARWRSHPDQAVNPDGRSHFMRTSILLWSTASGAILGIFLDATLLGVALLLSALLPAVGMRLHHRWIAISGAVVLVLIPVALAVLGYLEGELKTV